jgi:hypothetical protein
MLKNILNPVNWKLQSLKEQAPKEEENKPGQKFMDGLIMERNCHHYNFIFISR